MQTAEQLHWPPKINRGNIKTGHADLQNNCTGHLILIEEIYHLLILSVWFLELFQQCFRYIMHKAYFRLFQ